MTGAPNRPGSVADAQILLVDGSNISLVFREGVMVGDLPPPNTPFTPEMIEQLEGLIKSIDYGTDPNGAAAGAQRFWQKHRKSGNHRGSGWGGGMYDMYGTGETDANWLRENLHRDGRPPGGWYDQNLDPRAAMQGRPADRRRITHHEGTRRSSRRTIGNHRSSDPRRAEGGHSSLSTQRVMGGQRRMAEPGGRDRSDGSNPSGERPVAGQDGWTNDPDTGNLNRRRVLDSRRTVGGERQVAGQDGWTDDPERPGQLIRHRRVPGSERRVPVAGPRGKARVVGRRPATQQQIQAYKEKRDGMGGPSGMGRSARQSSRKTGSSGMGRSSGMGGPGGSGRKVIHRAVDRSGMRSMSRRRGGGLKYKKKTKKKQKGKK
jgi:hypothetical protein